MGMAPNLLGAESVKKLVNVAIDLNALTHEVLVDGKFSLWRLRPRHLGMLTGVLSSAGEIDFKQVFPEVKDLSPAEYEEVVGILIARLKFSREAANDRVHHFLGISSRLFSSVKEMIAFFKYPAEG